jgi:transposase InsO family protein
MPKPGRFSSSKTGVYQLEMQVAILQKHLHKKGKKPRYAVWERLLILWHMEAFQIPRRKVFRYFGIARSTLYRWLHEIENQTPASTAANKTPTEIASLVSEITKANRSWGRIRIANQLKLLGICLAASTVRNILQRPKPRSTPTSAAPTEKAKEEAESHSIPVSYPNHVWLVDTTTVLCWGPWPIQVLVAIDHFSRKVVCAFPLEGPNAGWLIEALECAMRKHGAPKHLISDRASVFIGDVFAELLRQWTIKPRLGAVGKKGSIAVTERAMRTLKYEWLKRVPIVKGFDHLASLCMEFEHWYNAWRPRMTLEGLRPDEFHYERKPRHQHAMRKTCPAIPNVMSSPRRGSLPIAWGAVGFRWQRPHGSRRAVERACFVISSGAKRSRDIWLRIGRVALRGQISPLRPSASGRNDSGRGQTRIRHRMPAAPIT